MQDYSGEDSNKITSTSDQKKAEPPPLPILLIEPTITEKIIKITNSFFKNLKKICIMAIKENIHLYKILTTNLQFWFNNLLIKKIPDSEKLKTNRENYTYRLSQLKTYSLNWWSIIATWLIIFICLKIIHLLWLLLF